MEATIRQHKGASAFYYLLPIQRGEIGDHSCLNSTETDFENVQVGSTIPMLVKAPFHRCSQCVMQTLLAISILCIPVDKWRIDRSYNISAYGESRGNLCYRFTSSKWAKRRL